LLEDGRFPSPADQTQYLLGRNENNLTSEPRHPATPSLTAVSDGCSVNSSRRGALGHSLHRSQALGGSFTLVALRAARASIPNHSGVGSLGLTGPLVSIDPSSSDERDGARESAHQTRARPRAVAADRAPTELTGIPNDRRTSRGFLHRSTRPRCSGTHDAS
jgi:hypothetical protein